MSPSRLALVCGAALVACTAAVSQPSLCGGTDKDNTLYLALTVDGVASPCLVADPASRPWSRDFCGATIFAGNWSSPFSQTTCQSTKSVYQCDKCLKDESTVDALQKCDHSSMTSDAFDALFRSHTLKVTLVGTSLSVNVPIPAVGHISGLTYWIDVKCSSGGSRGTKTSPQSLRVETTVVTTSTTSFNEVWFVSGAASAALGAAAVLACAGMAIL
eukprot:m51a1_g3907 putative C-tail anchored protein (216) ;mRNA; r:130105-130752